MNGTCGKPVAAARNYGILRLMEAPVHPRMKAPPPAPGRRKARSTLRHKVSGGQRSSLVESRIAETVSVTPSTARIASIVSSSAAVVGAATIAIRSCRPLVE